MSGGTPFIGSKLNLISKAEIRYEGILYAVDTKESTVTLSKVRSYGTEDRSAPKPIPPRSEVYEYIIFRGSDIKDLNVSEMPRAEDPPADPAIVSAHHSLSMPSSSVQNPLPDPSAMRSLPPASFTGQNPPHPHPHPPPPHHIPGGFSPFGPPIGGYNPFSMPYFRPLIMGQNLPHLPTQTPGGHPPQHPSGPQLVPPQQQQTQPQPQQNQSQSPPTQQSQSVPPQDTSLPSFAAPVSSESNMVSISSALGITSTPLKAGDVTVAGRRADDQQLPTPIVATSVVKPVTQPPHPQEQLQPQQQKEEVTSTNASGQTRQPFSSDAPSQQKQQLKPSVASSAPPTSSTASKDKPPASPKAGAKKGSSGGGRNPWKRPYSNNQGGRGYGRGGYGGYYRGNYQNYNTRSRGGGRGNADKRVSSAEANNRKQTFRYDSEFDFESANARFSKEQLEEEIKQKLKISENLPDTTQELNTAIEENPLLVQQAEDDRRQGAAEPTSPLDCYDKSKSFFDSISCESGQTEGNRRISRNEEYVLNTETFGVADGYRGRGRGRYGGYSRGGYRPRSRGYYRGYQQRYYRGYGGGRGYYNRQQQSRNTGNDTAKIATPGQPSTTAESVKE